MTNTWEEVERNETHIKCRARNYADTTWIFCVTRITHGHPTHSVTPSHVANEVELGVRGCRYRLAGEKHWQNSDDYRSPEIVAPTEDRHVAARRDLALKLDSEDPELVVGLETQRKPAQKEARERNIAALRADLDSSTSARRRALGKRFGARPGIDDTGGGSGPGWED